MKFMTPLYYSYFRWLYGITPLHSKKFVNDLTERLRCHP